MCQIRWHGGIERGRGQGGAEFLRFFCQFFSSPSDKKLVLEEGGGDKKTTSLGYVRNARK